MLHGQALSFSRRVCARVLPNSDICSPHERSDMRGRSRSFNVHPGFRCAHPGYKRKKGSGTPADAVVQVPHASGVRGAPRIKSACADPSAYGRARLPAFHHGSRPRESSSLRLSLGQASWDAAGTLDPVSPPQPGGGDLALLHGHDTRAVLSQSSEAPRAPVVMPAGMMPKPPGCAADEAAPAGTALAPAGRHHRTASLEGEI